MLNLKHLAIPFSVVALLCILPVLGDSAQVPEVAFHFTMDEINGDETMDVNGLVGILENGPVVVPGKHGNAIEFTRASEQAIEIFPGSRHQLWQRRCEFGSLGKDWPGRGTVLYL